MSGCELPHLSDREFLEPDKLKHEPVYRFREEDEEAEKKWKSDGAVLLVKNRLTKGDEEIMWTIVSRLLLCREVLAREKECIKLRTLEKIIVKMVYMVFQKGRQSLSEWLRHFLRRLVAF